MDISAARDMLNAPTAQGDRPSLADESPPWPQVFEESDGSNGRGVKQRIVRVRDRVGEYDVSWIILETRND